MKSTNKFDKFGKEIFEGDRALYSWSNGIGPIYAIHIIRKEIEKDHYDDDDNEGYKVIRFYLGNCYNRWRGKEVIKLSEEELAFFNIKEEVRFYLNSNNRVVSLLTDDDYDLYNIDEKISYKGLGTD
jgi:hypothetical protein